MTPRNLCCAILTGLWLSGCASLQPLDPAAAELQNSLALAPELADKTLRVTQAEDGTIQVGGFVENLEEMAVLEDILEEAEENGNEVQNSVVISSSSNNENNQDDES